LKIGIDKKDFKLMLFHSTNAWEKTYATLEKNAQALVIEIKMKNEK